MRYQPGDILPKKGGAIVGQPQRGYQVAHGAGIVWLEREKLGEAAQYGWEPTGEESGSLVAVKRGDVFVTNVPIGLAT